MAKDSAFEGFERRVLRTRTYLEYKVGRAVVAASNPDDFASRGNLSFLLLEALRQYRRGEIHAAYHGLGIVQGVLIGWGEMSAAELHALESVDGAVSA